MSSHLYNLKTNYADLGVILIVVAVVWIWLHHQTTAIVGAVTPTAPTDRTNLSFTSNGYTSTYHLYAGGLDWSGTKPVGLLIYTDGPAQFGLKNPKDTYLMGGGAGMIAVAKKHNMILLTPLSPNRICSDGDGSCWYLGDPPGYTRWAEALVKLIQSQYPIDKKRIAFGGYSSGAQFATEYWVPLGRCSTDNGGWCNRCDIIWWFAEMPEVGYTPSFRSNVHMNWNVGEKDDSYLLNDETEGPEQGYNVKAGYDHYTSAGFRTSLDVLRGVDHNRDGEFGAVMDAQIAKHVW